MKTLQGKISATLTALFLGSYVWVPTFAATPEQQPGSASPAQTEKIGDTCTRLDKDQDSYISVSEWKGLKKDAKAFMSADANQDGQLDLIECAKALGS